VAFLFLGKQPSQQDIKKAGNSSQLLKDSLFGVLPRDNVLFTWQAPLYFCKDFSLCFLVQK